MKRDDLYVALNAITLALRFAQTAARPFALDVDKLEAGSQIARSVAFIKNRITDAQESLSAAQREIPRLLLESLFE